jgi:predicted site-specific integrase-resolvase
MNGSDKKGSSMYTLTDASVLLCISQLTLRRWIARGNIQTIHGEADRRYRYLSEEHVLRLAREHHRVLAQTDVTQLAAEIATLKAKVHSLEQGE